MDGVLVFIGLGSNQGNTKKNLAEAVLRIDRSIGPVIKQSSLYKTKPWGIADQPDFLNQVILAESRMNAYECMHSLLNIENHMGRERTMKWGPRKIDLDLLYFDQLILNTSQLILPHPEIVHRRFVLAPLCEIAPDFYHPIFNKTNFQLLDECSDLLSVELA